METLELQDSAKRRGHFALYNCLVLGQTKHNGVQRVYCNPFPDHTFYGSPRLNIVIHRVSIMEASLHLILFGMLGFFSCSQHLLLLTPDPSPSTGHLCQCRKPTTILRIIIISIMTLIHIMAIIHIIPLQVGWSRRFSGCV